MQLLVLPVTGCWTNAPSAGGKPSAEENGLEVCPVDAVNVTTLQYMLTLSGVKEQM